MTTDNEERKFDTIPMMPLSTSPTTKPSRIQSIDFLRGIAMIIMALDHVRDYFHADAFVYSATDLTKTTGAIFFTRWITHFCAPVFMFLAGTSAYFVGQRKTKGELSIFLLKRGVWLMFVDFFIMTFFWNFDPNFNVFLINVLWCFGISMILLALLIHLPISVILGIGVFISIAHHLWDGVELKDNRSISFLFALLHQQGAFTFAERTFFIVYPIIPWFGVMAVGYCMGTLYTNDYSKRKRKRTLVIVGSICVLLFVVLRGGNFYGDPSLWSYQSSPWFSFMSFLNTSKYPPSFLFLLMTLGPALLFLAFTENLRGKAIDIVSIYGQVPLFYYIIHVNVIHLLALLAAELSPGFSWFDMILRQSFLDTSNLSGYGFSLGIVYVIWFSVVIMLFPLCKWYNSFKKSHKKNAWVTYL